MKIELGNIQARVVQASDNERAWLQQYLSFEDQRSKFTRRRDGSIKVNATKRISLLNLDDSFPAGLVRHVKKAMLEQRLILQVVDKRTAPCAVLSWDEALGDSDLWLYDFQQEAIEKALSRTRGIWSIPTGGGKTEAAVGLAIRLGQTNTLFIAPEADLMHNAARRWELRVPGVPAGRMGDGYFDPRDGFTSATFQTLSSRLGKRDPKLLKYLGSVGCTIIDEVHTLPSDSFYAVAQAIPAYWRIGMSGTPLARSDRRSLFSIAATGSIIYKVDTQLLIDREFIAKPHIRMIRCVQELDAERWQKSYATNIVGSRYRNELVVRVAKQAPCPGLVFVREQKHGKILTKMLKAQGLNVEFVWGEKSISQRDEAIRKLREGDLDFIVCSVVFQTGTDIPEVLSLVVAAGGKSEIATLQRIGRGMRIVRDQQGNVIKNEFWVYDIMDAEPTARAGITGNRWNANHSRERFKSYAGVGHEVTIKDGI